MYPLSALSRNAPYSPANTHSVPPRLLHRVRTVEQLRKNRMRTCKRAEHWVIEGVKDKGISLRMNGEGSHSTLVVQFAVSPK